MDSIQEATLAVFATDVIVDNEHNRLLLLRWHRQTDGRKHSKDIGARRERESPSGTKGQKACKSYLKGSCMNPS